MQDDSGAGPAPPAPQHDSIPYPDRFPAHEGMPVAALRRYVIGESSASERRRVEAWASASSERRRYLAALARILARADGPARRRAAAAWTRLAARLAPPVGTTGAPAAWEAPWERPVVRVDVARRRPPRLLTGAFAPRTQPRPWLVAAGLALAAGVAGALIGSAPRTGATGTTPAAMRQIVTARGQRAEVQLGDGSLVVLGVASRLRIASDFGSRTRDLYLDGTAYFDVVHDPAHPFRVHTAQAVTQDVGTRFVVSAYHDATATQVVVADGAVALASSRGATPVVLTRGRLGRLARGAATPTVRRVDPALYTAWMQGELVFHDTPLSRVVAELRRWYDIDLRLGDAALAQVPLTASFTAESAAEALRVVTTAVPLRIVRHGRVTTLYPR